ncbi:peptidase M6 [Streptomyces sp. NPDC049555]|uniref:peptidase M6 n=1 Tax=Streptomyces sp. NPDC049555 TaxID=3154930 RepID=UPI00341ADBA1
MPTRLRLLATVLALTATLTAPAPAATAAGRAAAHPAAADCALAGRTGWTDEGHDTDPVQFQPATGTRRVLTIFVDFPDAPATEPTAPYAAHLAPAAGWLRTASYGRLRLDVTASRRWARMPQASTAYGFQRGLSFEAHERYLRDAITAADPYEDFSSADMVYVVPVRTATAIPFSPTYLFDPATAGVTADGRRIKWAVTFGQDMWRWGHKVAAHETGHTFGLPDLYAFTGETHGFVGGWDVMGHIAGAAPQYLGWHSWKLGWTRDDQVACFAGPRAGSRTVRLTPVERPGGTKIAVVRTGPTTAYVAESRRAAGNDPAPCSTGVLIYKVDSAVATGEGPVRVIGGRSPGAPPCGPLDLAARAPGDTFTDPATSTRIEVLAGGRTGDVVRVTRLATLPR